MRLNSFMVVTLLSLSLLSYGVAGAAFADNHDVPPISVKADNTKYKEGDKVTITGKIKNYNATKQEGYSIVLRVLTSSESPAPVTIGQITPNADGTFEHTLTAGGKLWKTSGDYIIRADFNSQTAKTTINYVTTPKPVVEPPKVEEKKIEPPKVPEKKIEPQEVEITTPLVQPPEPPTPICGNGTAMVNGVCEAIAKEVPTDDTGGCLIATATYGTELAPQVQFLREIRDNTVLSTASGMSFMAGFNTLYYSFAPTVADWERESPMFKEAVRVFITPMISTLSIMSLAQDGSESDVFGLGILVIMLNLGMYIAAPALIGFKVTRYIKSRKIDAS